MREFKWFAAAAFYVGDWLFRLPAFAKAECAWGKPLDVNTAIADCTRDIKSGTYKGKALALKYGARASVYTEKNDSTNALADYNEAIRLNPTDGNFIINAATVYLDIGEFTKAIKMFDGLSPDSLSEHGKEIVLQKRGASYEGLGNLEKASSNYDELIRLNPSLPSTYQLRGFMKFHLGSGDNGLGDFKTAISLGSKDRHLPIWIEFIAKRRGLPSELSQSASQIDMTKWPAPVIRLFLGQMTVDELFGATNDPDPEAQKRHVCDAEFYSAEFALTKGNKADAIRLFHRALDDCPSNNPTWIGANVELKAL